MAWRIDGKTEKVGAFGGVTFCVSCGRGVRDCFGDVLHQEGGPREKVSRRRGSNCSVVVAFERDTRRWRI